MKTYPIWKATKTNDNGKEVSAEFQLVDNGIGAYECHGFKGSQTLLNAEFVSCEIEVSEKEIERWETEETEKFEEKRAADQEKDYKNQH